MAANYDDVVDQLTLAGLQVGHLVVGKMARVKVEGDRERRGWYMLHELTLDGGDQVIVGSYGIWRGNDNGATKIELKRRELSPEQREAIRKRLADDRKRVDAESKSVQAKAARRAEAAWLKSVSIGDHDYLVRKGVQGFGVKYSPKGALVIPMTDPIGKIHGLQFILSRAHHGKRIDRTGRDKEFWPAGLAKKGHFHLIGAPGPVCLVAEGYATGATLHMATGLPVAVAFDAGNLLPVVESLAKRYKGSRWLICADDDAYGKCVECKAPVKVDEGKVCPACGKPHKRENAGVMDASVAALAVGGAWVRPVFVDDDGRWSKFVANGNKTTDFNDLHLIEGLHTVRAQIEAKISALGWRAEVPTPRGGDTGGAGNGDALRPIESYDELLERFSLIYGHNGTVFDHAERKLLALSDMRDACISREIHRRWQESAARRIYRVEEVGFDPSESDGNIKCNLWGGWPTTPKSGSCERLLELLQYMCSADDNPGALYRWALNWFAYPIQHPGAKMRTTLVIHGPQGTGKNLFCECVMAIYGRYGRIIDQSAIEDKFNDCFSRKLFMIADEVVARSDLYHVKNKIKGLVTGEWIRINPKNVSAYEERNHVNIVFLSNEAVPSVLEQDDRRHAVIWTPQKLSPTFYAEVAEEVRNGGIAALHDYLLTVDLGDFNEHTKPPMTRAKADLIELSLDSITRFLNAWVAKDLDGVPVCAARSEDVFSLYRAWCHRQGIGKAAQLNTLIGTIAKKPGVRKERKRWMSSTELKQATCIFPPGSAELPAGESEVLWITQQFELFERCVNDYRGSYVP